MTSEPFPGLPHQSSCQTWRSALSTSAIQKEGAPFKSGLSVQGQDRGEAVCRARDKQLLGVCAREEGLPGLCVQWVLKAGSV